MTNPRHKLLALLALSTTQIASSSILKLSSFKHGTYQYSPQSSLTLSELIKLLLSLLYHISQTRPRPLATLASETTPPLILHMSALALLYAANNALTFHLFAHADPGTIALVKSAGTLVSAPLMYLTRRFRLSPCRWLVVILQTVGLIITQYNACNNQPFLQPRIYTLLLLSLVNSSVANVWNEHAIKSHKHASLPVKNVYLYLFGAVFNGLYFAYLSVTNVHTPRFLQGYDYLAVLVVLCNSLMGVSINAVYKYADALVKNIATSCTTVVLVFMSAVWWGGKADLMTVLGGTVVIGGMILYFWTGMLEQMVRELRQLKDGPAWKNSVFGDCGVCGHD